MRKSPVALLLLSLVTSLAAAQSRTAIPNTVPPRAKLAGDLGPAPSDRVIPGITLRFLPTSAQSEQLAQLLADQQNPASPRYHQWLTPEQYATQFGPDPAAIQSISAWLQSQGLTVTGIARGRSFIAVSGTVAQLQQAFSVTLHNVALAGETHVAPLSDPTIPSEFAPLISGITGLDDFRLKPSSRIHQEAHPEYTSAVTGSHYLAPGDIYTIYGFSPLLSGIYSAPAITIAVLGQTDISLADVAAFRLASGLVANVPTVNLYSVDPGISAADIDEAQLDVEWAGAIAPSASILYVNSTNVISGSLTAAVDNNLAPIISLSYGACESGFGPGNIAIYQQLLLQANAQGQTVIAAAGDSGATDCDFQTGVAAQGLAVAFPASSPNVTAVGGTMFNEGSGTYWASTNAANSGTALSYIPETVWNETAALNTLAASGGGASDYFTKPTYQSATGVPNDFSRDVPDIALAAGSAHDGYLFCSQGWCTNGFRNASGQLDVAGGTSVATPVFAGILALVEQKIKNSYGNINPVLYALANNLSGPAVFHDITSGNNTSPCATGSIDCPTGGVIGYTATTGYDLASGLGSVDVDNLATALQGIVLIRVSNIGSAASSTVLTSSAGIVVAGTPVTLTATVTSAASPAPSGTVQFLVDNVPTGNGVPLANSTVAYTLATGSLASGTHILTAAYSGDATYAGSKGAVNLTVTIPTTGDFTLTPSTASTTIAAGGTAPGITFTATSLNGFSGSVAFTASATVASLPAQYAFNVDPVAVTATTPGSTVLTLVAYIPGAQTTHSAALAVLPTLTLAGLLFLALPRRRRPLLLLLALLSIALLTATGCTNPPAPSVSTGPAVTATPTGTYTILVTATGTNSTGAIVTHNATVTFTVN